MKPIYLQIIYSAVLVICIMVVRFAIVKLISKRIVLHDFSNDRRKAITKVVNVVLIVFLVVIGTSIWGLNKSEIALFITSVLTVLGVAFFAQWSHLSNVTSGVILFFNSDIKIGDHITILDKDFNISGSIENIGALFLKIKTDEAEIISIPNNIILQKAVRIK